MNSGILWGYVWVRNVILFNLFSHEYMIYNSHASKNGWIIVKMATEIYAETLENFINPEKS
jgi:hypothetical protein